MKIWFIRGNKWREFSLKCYEHTLSSSDHFFTVASPARIICFLRGVPKPSFKLNVYYKIQCVFLVPEAGEESQLSLMCNKTQGVRKALEKLRLAHDCQD